MDSSSFHFERPSKHFQKKLLNHFTQEKQKFTHMSGGWQNAFFYAPHKSPQSRILSNKQHELNCDVHFLKHQLAFCQQNADYYIENNRAFKEETLEIESI